MRRGDDDVVAIGGEVDGGGILLRLREERFERDGEQRDEQRERERERERERGEKETHRGGVT